MLRIIFFLIVMGFPLFLSSQNELEWGEISESERQLQKVDFDKDADAVILNHQGEGHFEFNGSRSIFYQKSHIRIKILRESGLKHADVKVLYPDHMRIYKINAQTILPNGEKVKLKKEDIYEEDYDDETKMFSFSFPKAKVGAILEYQFLKRTEYIINLPTWYFQEDIATLHSRLRLLLPPYYSYINIHNNGMNIKQLGPKLVFDNRLNTEVSQHIFHVDSLPGVQAENYITTIKDYYTYTRFQLHKVHFSDHRGDKEILSSWDQMAEKLRGFSDVGLQYTANRKINRTANEILPLFDTVKSDLDKIHKLYVLLNEKLNWNGEYSIFCTDDLEDVFDAKVGNSADLNLMFIALLRQMDIEAHPVFISTRSNGAPLPLYPIVTQFNHIVAYVKVNDSYELYDLSERFLPYNCVRYNSLNQKGWLVTDKDQKWIQIPAQKGSDIIVFQASIFPQEMKVTGKLQGKYTYHNSIPERDYHFDQDKGEHWKERLSSTYSSVDVKHIENENLHALEKAFMETVDLELEGGMTVIDSFVYFKPITYSNFDKNLFKQETRHCPVDIGHPMNETLIYNYEIPEDYMIEDLPENVVVRLEGKSGTYKYLVSYNENSRILQVMSQLDINTIIYPPEKYKYLKALFSQVAKKLEEQVVLRKT